VSDADETKFTPGPWRHVAEGGWDGVMAPGGMVVCKLVLNEPRNANLIAAAPEIYAALHHAETVMMIVQPRSHMREYLAALEQARAALAKARGES
jgi:hypothetical protein